MIHPEELDMSYEVELANTPEVVRYEQVLDPMLEMFVRCEYALGAYISVDAEGIQRDSHLHIQLLANVLVGDIVRMVALIIPHRLDTNVSVQQWVFSYMYWGSRMGTLASHRIALAYVAHTKGE